MVSLSKVADKSSNTSADRSPESMASRISDKIFGTGVECLTW